MYNPSADCGDETHNLRELYDKAQARRAQFTDRTTHPHMQPSEDGHYDTLSGGYEPTLHQDLVNGKMKVVKEKKKSYKIEDWYKYQYAHKFKDLREGWLKDINEIDQQHINNTTPELTGIRGVDRFHYKDVSYEWFVQHYEKTGTPCMISGFTDEWEMNKWTLKNMVSDHIKNEFVKVGKDHSGRRLDVDFEVYAQYVHTNKDDSSVYLFESQIDRTPGLAKIFDAYTPPTWFTKDLLDFCPADRRPPCRWFCIGQMGTGTTIHADPLYLLAWNSVLAGRKIWISFDEKTPEEIATGEQFMTKPRLYPNIENEAVGWFDRVWPQLVQWLKDNELCAKYNPRIFIQYPGETIFMPGGVWHYVLNFDDTLAVTQNYVNMSNFGLVWKDFRKERRHAALRWLSHLKRRYPLAYETAMAMNKADNFNVVLKKPHLKSAHQEKVDAIRVKLTQTPDTVSAADKALVEAWDANHREDKTWDLVEEPFGHSAAWELWSGTEDSSTDSDESEEEETSSDDDSDSE